MSLMISYEPPEGGNVSYIEVALSESYEDAINAACTLLKNRLPPDDCILGRYLARQMERGGEIRWARISEPLFRQLVQNTPEDLELRLELDTIQTSQRRRDTSSTPSSLIMPSPLLESNNQGIPNLDDSSSITETGATNNPSTPLHTPLTPTSLISNNKRSTYYQEPSIVDPPICLNPPTYPPSLASTNMARNRTFEDGLNALFAGQFSNARTRFQLAADECHDTGDAFQEAECLLRLGMTCRHLKDYPAAISHLSTSRTIYESLDSRREQLQCERNLARVSEDQGNYQESLRTYQEIKASARAMGTPGNNSLGSLPTTSMDNPRESINPGRHSEGPTPSMRSNPDWNPALKNGLSAYSTGQYHDAYILFQVALDYSRETGNRRQEAECMSHLGTIHRYNKDYPNARSHFSEARRIYQTLGECYPEEQLQCDRQLVQVDERTGDYRTALHAYESIKATARDKGFRKQEAGSMVCLRPRTSL
ncbi:unnamed protein product [Rhizoctonia solani]|uniref:TPR-like protein n=1 Tax=Rhizoctonia solani TaxID=456999 RepID=A0A8H3GCH5_9AGAM|nr:unnamed protein product [Rhizoctonia solani]